MKIADEIAESVRDMFSGHDCPEDTEKDIASTIAAKLEPVKKAFRELFDKSDVDDGNYMEYEAAEQALALFEEE